MSSKSWTAAETFLPIPHDTGPALDLPGGAFSVYEVDIGFNAAIVVLVTFKPNKGDKQMSEDAKITAMVCTAIVLVAFIITTGIAGYFTITAKTAMENGLEQRPVPGLSRPVWVSKDSPKVEEEK